jgi:hypothetical protein
MSRLRVGTWDGVAKVLRGLAEKGCEVRVPLVKEGRDGRPVFAVSGRQSVYEIPRFAPQERSADPAALSVRAHNERTAVAV